MKITLTILLLAALLLSIGAEATAVACIEDVATGVIYCPPEPPISPVAQPVQRVWFTLVLRE